MADPAVHLVQEGQPRENESPAKGDSSTYSVIQQKFIQEGWGGTIGAASLLIWQSYIELDDADLFLSVVFKGRSR